MDNPKETFKLIIREFHESSFPEIKARDLEIPANPKKIISVYGPRRSGKSFFFLQCMKKLHENNTPRQSILYVNFDDDRILPVTYKDLDSLLEAFFELYPENKERRVFIFLDEIQNVPNWELFARRIYDKENAAVFVTGSHSRLFTSDLASALRGRTLTYKLSPLSFREFLRFRGLNVSPELRYGKSRFAIKKIIDEYLEFGGFPEVVLEENSSMKMKILKEYLVLLVYRDLIDKFKLDNSGLLKDILLFFSTNITKFFTVNSYFNSIRMVHETSRDTITKYVNAILESGYFYLTEFFSNSQKERRSNPKKILCLDTGLRNATVLRFSHDQGKLAENLCGISIFLKHENLFYWKGKGEVDFVYRTADDWNCINVTFGHQIDQRELNSLDEITKTGPAFAERAIITKDTEKTMNGIHLMPLWKWLLESDYPVVIK